MNSFRLLWPTVGLAIFSYALTSSPAASKVRDKVEFNRDIRPIIWGKCLACHGNDKNAVRAGLHLDFRAGATKLLSDGSRAIVPGKPDESEIVRRINRSQTSALLMPPAESHKILSQEEKLLLRQWIAEGAEYKPHWAFVRPLRPLLPKVREKNWVRNPIDTFILATLEKNGLKPSGEADRATLIRRVTLDLTGMTPSPADVDKFVADRQPDAYERLVDKLLASPRYGERMAMDWCDYARYADSNGYQADWERFQWRWRDYVINAFNNNMPYDQFTVEQLAGDLLPHPTRQQIIATGFNRNHRINTEGGVIPEEWRVEGVIDRVETTSAVWLGLTTGCARCHDHKYDPIKQKDFYSLSAYFNNVPETGTGEERPVNHPPLLETPTPEQEIQRTTLSAKVKQENNFVETTLKNNRAVAANWAYAPKPIPATLADQRLATYTFKADGSGFTKMGNPTFEAGRASGAVVTDPTSWLDLGNVADFERDKPFSYACWVNSEDGNGSPIAKMDVKSDFRGWDLHLAGGTAAIHLIHKWPENAVKVFTEKPIPLKEWTHIAVTYDGSSKAAGVHFFINGAPVETGVERDSLTETIRTKIPTTVGRRTTESEFRGKVDNVVFYNRVITPDEVIAISGIDPIKALLDIAPKKRTPDQARSLTDYWSQANVPTFAATEKRLGQNKSALDMLQAQIPTVMVMQEMPKRRQAYILIRGLYDKHGAPVEMATPAALPPIPKGVPNNRLGLAKWIVDPSNPLTGRVTMNRLWERFFGEGIVSTVEDFGTRAEFPSHPELLDWLAVDFVESKWNLKRAIRQIVTSATYRQSSSASPAMMAKDPANRLLAHAPRFRLPAEIIRDQALYAGGLLVEKIGGPSVRPYAPPGLWDEFGAFGNLRNYKHDMGPGLYRRSLYTIWKRTAAPPEMTLFDAPSRETCRVHRPRTNTPMQALVLLNDETYIEAARAIAQRAMRESTKGPETRINFIFRSLLARRPTANEMSLLSNGYARRLAHFNQDPGAAKKLVSIGVLPIDTKDNVNELAAYTLVASTVLNLDEAVTKE